MSDIENILPPLLADDGTPHLLCSENASLEPLRSCKSKQVKISEATNATEQDNGKEREIILSHLQSASVSLTLPSQSFSNMKGQIFVTTKRLLFVGEAASSDFSMNAYCISLHALMSEPRHSIYCQLNDEVGGSDDEEGPSSKEVIIEPLCDDGEHQSSCQNIFESLSKLISLNPMDDDDDGGFGSGGGGGLASMLGMMASAYGGDENDETDDLICRIDPSQMITASNIDGDEVGASAEERRKMLEKMDSMLVVPPEYDLDGQFDDAEDDLDSTDKNIL
jgi:hypothetical protein